MKKIISLLFILSQLLLCLGGCATNQADTYLTYYGVMKYSPECKREVLYIPGYGDFELPECDNIKSYFDESTEELDGYSPKVGDLLRVTFKLEGGSDTGVEILECYPSRFGRAAYSIDAIKEGIQYKATDEEYIFSFPETEDIRNTEVGDTLYFVIRGGSDGRAFVSLYAEGEIVEKHDGTVTVKLLMHSSPDEFLKRYTDMEVKLIWEQ